MNYSFDQVSVETSAVYSTSQKVEAKIVWQPKILLLPYGIWQIKVSHISNVNIKTGDTHVFLMKNIHKLHRSLHSFQDR